MFIKKQSYYHLISKPIIGKEEIDAVVRVLRSGTVAQGPEVGQLEKSFCELTGRKYAVAMNSGTAVIHAALYGLGIGQGDEVICPPFTFVATANAVLMAGATPVFCDINQDDYMINPKMIEAKITEKTKAIIAVSLYGQVFRYDEIKKIADTYNLKIIEDAAQSIGATYKGIPSGGLGDVGTFSLYATKNIHCAEGGILVTDDEECYEKAKMIRHHGQSEKTRYEYHDLGYNYRLTDIHAAIANQQMKKLDWVCKKRQENANLYNSGLADLYPIIQTPYLHEGNMHVYHQYVIKILSQDGYSRDGLMQYLKDLNIGCGVYYPKPLHLHPHFSRIGYSKGDFPVSEQASQEVLSLPVHPLLSSDDIFFIISAIKSYVNKH
ncbi:MAG: DegT/DnrJ/EryC1/StrS family aminotransferase [Candidatus Absconditabacterales bacterium]|nr:DegT/DnrJ/EryC1/StrS family aminotransferase [Candidatus Absconditabacterales bacterium]